MYSDQRHLVKPIGSGVFVLQELILRNYVTAWIYCIAHGYIQYLVIICSGINSGKAYVCMNACVCVCVCVFVRACMCAKSLHSCRTLCDLMDCSPPGSFIRGILQARILEWVAMPSSKGSSQPSDRTQVSHIAGGFFTI